MSEEIVWTALPNGHAGQGSGRRLRVSVLVSPRLRGDEPETTLHRFPDFVSWPDTVAKMTFGLQFGTAPSLPAERQGPPPDAALWRMLFPPDTLVRSHQFDDWSRSQLISYDTRRVCSGLRSLYGSLAVPAGQGLLESAPWARGYPTVLSTALDDRGFNLAWNDTTAAQARRQLSQPSAALSDKEHIARFLLFHRRPAHPTVTLPEGAEGFRKVLDFHQAVSSLGDYPRLLRLLGLVVDLEVLAAAAEPLATTDPQPLRVRPTWQPMDSNSPAPGRSPATLTTWDGDVFAAEPASGELAGGLLPLANGSYELVDLDVDGAALKALNMRLGLNANPGGGSPGRSGLPSLRSVGLALVRAERGRMVGQHFADMKAHNDVIEGSDPEAATFNAEQLVRGQIIDVFDGRLGRWCSLCQRVGTYTFGEPGDQATVRRLTLNDEGFVELAVTGAPRPADADPPPPGADLYLHDALVRWDGWSAVVPRPGKSLHRDADPTSGAERPDNEAVTPFKLVTSFIPAPRSLPALRFGVGYRLRARAVDLAGNCPSLEEAGDAHVLPAPGSPERIYMRYDPVPPPLVVLRQRLTERGSPGESLERMVLRSGNRSDELDGPRTALVVERHIAPPRTSQAMAEAHGAFDGPDGRIRGDEGTHAMIHRRDAAQLALDGDTPIEPAPQLVVSHLPDVLARGAALRDLPGVPHGATATVDDTGRLVVSFAAGPGRPGSATLIGFGDADRWPDMLAFRLVVAEGDAVPEWDAGARTLTVFLPKAEVATVPLSSFVVRSDLRLLGVWEWMREHVETESLKLGGSPEKLATFVRDVAVATRSALEGGHWMLTPARDLVLVHAVQQPLGHPEIGQLTIQRDIGETAAHLTGEVRVHAKSTAKIDLIADWTEVVDVDPDPTKGRATEEHVAELPLHDLGKTEVVDPRSHLAIGSYDRDRDTVALEPGRHPAHRFPDTRHRRVAYRVVATSRFAEYFRRQADVELRAIAAGMIDGEGVAPGSEAVTSADGATTYARWNGDGRGDYQIDYAKGTIVRMVNGSIPDGATVRVEYLPPVARSSERAVIVHVPSSARPDAPNVLYVVPTFGWVRHTDTNVMSSARTGGWLRVYLDRPWHSSGEGELLGVVDDFRYTGWGSDPLYSSPAVNMISFPSRVAAGNGTLEELTGDTVEVDAHEVVFDHERGLWFSDIQVAIRTSTPGATPAYEPFVRLGLVRYQPHSVVVDPPPGSDAARRDVKLSRVVLADFARLGSDRALVVTHDPEQPSTLRASVSGRAHLGTWGGQHPAPFVVSVEERRPGMEDELAWVPAEGVSVLEEAVPSPPPPPEILLWSGTVTLPEGRPLQDFRVVVKEFDTLIADDRSQSPRLLYADAVEVGGLAPPRTGTTTTLTSSPDPATYGQTVTFHASVGGQGGTPTGTMTFRDGDAALDTVELENGSASLATATLSAGSHQIAATYSGDPSFAPSEGTLIQEVGKAATTVDVVPRLEIHGRTPF